MARLKFGGHVHSMFSGKATRFCTPRRIINQAFKAGLDVLIVTDDSADEFFDAVRQDPRENLPRSCEPGYGFADSDLSSLSILRDWEQLCVYRGIEFHDDEQGHLLAWGYKGKMDPKPNYGVRDKINMVHDRGGIIGPAHTFATSIGGITREKLDLIREDIDFSEVRDACNFTCEGEAEALAYAEEHGLSAVCGDDSHRVKDVGMSPNLVNAVFHRNPEKTWESTKDAIIRGDLEMVGEKLSVWGVFDWMVLYKVWNLDVGGLVGLSKPLFRIARDKVLSR